MLDFRVPDGQLRSLARNCTILAIIDVLPSWYMSLTMLHTSTILVRVSFYSAMSAVTGIRCVALQVNAVF